MSARALPIAAVVGLIAGCSAQAAAPATPVTRAAVSTSAAAPIIGSIGQPVAFTDQLATPPAKGTVTINSAHREKAAADDPYATYGSYLVLDVTVAVVVGEVRTDATEFEAQGKSGHSYSAVAFADVQPLAGSARAGVLSRGNVALDVPSSDGPFRVVWSYGSMAGSTARAEFSVTG